MTTPWKQLPTDSSCHSAAGTRLGPRAGVAHNRAPSGCTAHRTTCFTFGASAIGVPNSRELRVDVAQKQERRLIHAFIRP